MMRGIILFFAVIIFQFFINNFALSTEKTEINQLSQLTGIIDIFSKFTNEINQAAGTPRFLIGQRISNLRSLKIEMESVNAEDCVSSVQDSAIKTMSFGIEGFERFSNQGSLSESSSFSLFRAYHDRTIREADDCIKKIKIKIEQKNSTQKNAKTLSEYKDQKTKSFESILQDITISKGYSCSDIRITQLEFESDVVRFICDSKKFIVFINSKSEEDPIILEDR